MTDLKGMTLSVTCNYKNKA